MTDEFRWYLLAKKRSEGLIVNAFREYRKHGIEPVLIKGWAAARNYPPHRPRFFGDVDLAVSEADFPEAQELIEQENSPIQGVDLHRELRTLDTAGWEYLFGNSQLVELDGEMIRILSPEDHLRVMTVHWLTNGGESLERLWDIAYAVENRPADFDWEKCLNVVSTERRGWVIATIGLAHRYLDIEIADLPFKDEAARLPSWLIRSVEKSWKSGVLQSPLHTKLRDPRALFVQIRKRVPPNPIQATVDCDGPFDDGPRFRYQVKDVFKRLGPSIKRVVPAILTSGRGSRT